MRRVVVVLCVAVVLPVVLAPTAFAHGSPGSPNPWDPGSHDTFKPLPGDNRAPRCADAGDWRIKAIYAYPKNKSNRRAALLDDIRTRIRDANGFVYQEGTPGLDRIDLKFDCNAEGVVEVPAVETRNAADARFWTIRQDVRNAGHDNPKALYIVFYDDEVPSEACGKGEIGHGSEISEYSLGSRYAAVFFEAGCGYSGAAGWAAGVALHEISHAMGAVQPSAPKATNGFHCNDGKDVMCYADGSSDSSYRETDCGAIRFDCNKDTYFDPKPEPGEWLYRNWNLGFCINRFISRTNCITNPRSLDANTALVGGVDLNWQAPAENGGGPVDFYTVSWTNSLGSSGSFTVNGSSTQTRHESCLPGATYTYKVKAQNVFKDESGFSNTDSAICGV